MLTVVACALSFVVLTGCSGESDRAVSAKLPAKPEVIISRAIDQVGPGRARLGSLAANEALLRAVLGVRGVPNPEIDCYLGKVLPPFGEAKFAALTVHQLQAWASVTVMDLPLETREASATCLSQATYARRKAKEIAPDLDLAATRRIIRTAAVAQAVAVGLTPAEADCYTTASMDRLTDEQFRDGLAGKATREVRQPEASIRSCLTPARRQRLARPLAAAIEAQAQIDDAERKVVESKLNAEVKGRIAAMTTTTAATTTTEAG